ncbi:hypothetical protein GCM10010448_40330 [Streptomyces glomeratus]|uniref:Secreted protein n=1 Tax=Streptomyces glomeratus TaxID=284452 RepID=A0ABP6LT77_9ACTN
MTAFCPSRSQRLAPAASALTVTVAAGLLPMTLTVSLPQTWWPRTGAAFATADRNADPCELIAGPTKAYCERGTASAQAARGRGDAAVGKLTPAATAAGALVVWRRRRPTGRGRR